MVVWIIGLSGSGKTTLASNVVQETRKTLNNIVLVDGDLVRQVFGDDLGHTIEDRRKNAERIHQLCLYLDAQGIHVVCAILSIFPDIHELNRKHIDQYYEIFIDASIDTVQHRDSKGIYEQYMKGEIVNVVGKDIVFPRPERPDLVIEDDQSLDELLSYTKVILDRLLSDK